MNVDPALKSYVVRQFAPLSQSPAHDFPKLGSLSNALAACAPAKSKTATQIPIKSAVVKMFSTAAVNTWMRAVHSFLVSNALTEVSPIWASVAGYYSSHYSVRATAHLLGFFQLFSIQKTVQLELSGGHFVGTFISKRGREHETYWKVVKDNVQFSSDPFFRYNETNKDPSDVAHRDRANYADHLPHFPTFRPLGRDEVVQRIHRISNIEIFAPPIPSIGKYPDVESVQLIAYHRLVRFRDLLDAILGGGNRFWSVNRDPAWARDFIDYQLVTSKPNVEAF